MIDDVYQTDLLKLAARARGAGRLPGPERTAKVDNPLCGDRITIDLDLEGGRVSAIGYEVKACVLCQASASALAEGAVGRRGDELVALGQAIEAMLKGRAEPPGEPWSAFAAFLPVRKAKSRHECVMLPFRALEEALARPQGEGS
jgi:nitrogen fixation protein NifU and related proteins